ncbi:helix-turn-helix domain-containing protein [Paenibacillus antri]|nr:helix-turn-helix domain-containing protein [Paenibacillus antri]
MNVVGVYRSKKYLQRILTTITLVLVGLLIVSSAAIYYTSEKTVLLMQRDTNEKILAQVNFNIANMNDVISNMAASLYFDPELVPLMTTKNIHIMDLIKKQNRLDSVVNATSFLHSIVVYNGFSDQVYSGGDSVFRHPESVAAAKLKAFLKEADGVVKMRLIPLHLFSKEPKVDVLSFMMYDESRSYNGKDSVFILNVKPEWLFDNVKMINDLAVKQASAIFLVDGRGNVLDSAGLRPAAIAEWESIRRLPELSAQGYGDFVIDVDGEKSLVTYSDTGISDLRVVTVQAYSAVLSDLLRMRTAAVAITIGFLIASVIVSLWVSHKLYEPVARLMNRIRKYEDDHQIRQQPDYDELSYASTAYEQAMENLNRAREHAKDKQKTLMQYDLRRLITDSATMTKGQFDQLIAQHRLPIRSQGAYTLAVLRIAEYGRRKDREADWPLFRFAISNIAQEIVSADSECISIDMRDDHLVVLLQRGGDVGDLVPTFESVQRVVREYYRLTIVVALSEPFEAYPSIAKQYDRTLQYSMYSIVYGPSRVILPHTVAENIENIAYQLPGDVEKKLVEGLKAADRKQLDDALDRAIAHISKLNSDFIMFSVMQVVVLIKNTIKEIGENRLQSIALDVNAFNRDVLNIQSLDELRELVSGLFRDIAEHGKSGKEERNDIVTETVKDIIKENYKDPNLNMQGLSSMVRISYDYLGRLFKKNETMSISDYINEVRLEQARILLETKDYSVSQIMEQVGFTNHSYFFKLFKKKFGTTPREYRLKKSLSP